MGREEKAPFKLGMGPRGLNPALSLLLNYIFTLSTTIVSSYSGTARSTDPSASH